MMFAAGKKFRSPWRLLRQEFRRYLVVGALAAAIHWAILWGGVTLFHLEGTLSTTLGFITSATLSYLLNYFWTFRSTASHALALPRFVVVAVCGLVLNATIFAGVKYGWEMHFFVAQGAATGIVLFWNFSLQRLWSFRA
jgi:putative flippase GtrA